MMAVKKNCLESKKSIDTPCADIYYNQEDKSEKALRVLANIRVQKKKATMIIQIQRGAVVGFEVTEKF